MTGGLAKAMCEACDSVSAVDGYVSPEELRLLFLAAANPTAQGEVVEIGSFKGKSTVVLAKGALAAGQQTVVACDPFTAPSPTDPVVDGPTYEEYAANLERCGVARNVETYRGLSTEMMKGWSRPVRLLWIDGDHRYAAAKAGVPCTEAVRPAQQGTRLREVGAVGRPRQPVDVALRTRS